MTRDPKLIALLVTCRQLEAWLAVDPGFQDWLAAKSYLSQLQSDLEPFLCPTCKEILPDSDPCWHNRFEEEEPDGVALADFCGDHPYKWDYNPWK